MKLKRQHQLIIASVIAVAVAAVVLYQVVLPKPDFGKAQIYNQEYYLHGFIVPFNNGSYAFGDKPSDEDYSRAGIDRYTLGDLDGDGNDDAAVIIEEDNGDAGSLVYLTVVLNNGNKPKAISDSAILGEQVDVMGFAIDKGEILLELFGFDADSGTEKLFSQRFVLDEGIMQEVHQETKD